MFCLYCGKPLPKEASFCPNCGKPCAQMQEPQPIDTHPPEITQQADTLPPTEQASGRYAAGDSRAEPTNAQQPERFAAFQPGSSAEQPALSMQAPVSAAQAVGVKKHRLPKWAFITICVAAALLIGLLILILANPEDFRPAPANDIPSAPEAPAETAPAAEETVQPKEGECLYVGNCAYFDIDNLKVSFILSADKSYIYNVKIELTNLSANFSDGSTNTNIKISSATESYSGQYPVDYQNGTGEIILGASTISNLCFDGATAWFALDYTYMYEGAGADTQYREIPFGTNFVEMATENDTEIYPPAAEEPSSEAANPETIFDESKLKNWDGETLLNATGVGDIYSFTPETPTPMYYIVCTDGVYDPVTGRESEGGYGSSYSRHLPISTDDLLYTSGNLQNGGLTLTDNPNEATYVLILHYSYENNIGTFTFSDGSVIPQYHATLDAELLNLVTGEILSSQTKSAYATYVNESVYTSMLDAAKGKQLYGGTIFLYSDDFEGYWDFVNIG